VAPSKGKVAERGREASIKKGKEEVRRGLGREKLNGQRPKRLSQRGLGKAAMIKQQS